MKKGVDKVEVVWYYNKAVTEDRKNEEMRREYRESRGSENLEKLQKVLDKLKTT